MTKRLSAAQHRVLQRLRDGNWRKAPYGRPIASYEALERAGLIRKRERKGADGQKQHWTASPADQWEWQLIKQP